MNSFLSRTQKVFSVSLIAVLFWQWSAWSMTREELCEEVSGGIFDGILCRCMDGIVINPVAARTGCFSDVYQQLKSEKLLAYNRNSAEDSLKDGEYIFVAGDRAQSLRFLTVCNGEYWSQELAIDKEGKGLLDSKGLKTSVAMVLKRTDEFCCGKKGGELQIRKFPVVVTESDIDHLKRGVPPDSCPSFLNSTYGRIGIGVGILTAIGVVYSYISGKR